VKHEVLKRFDEWLPLEMHRTNVVRSYCFERSIVTHAMLLAGEGLYRH
jgi:hypothetical protein